MVDAQNIPSLIGFRPDEAEAEATRLGLTVAWIDPEPPRWLSEHREPRVGRQRLLDGDTLELLRVQVPTLAEP